MIYRSRTEIVFRILRAADQGATKTKIMYGAFLSYEQLQDYIPLLVEKEMVRRDEATQLYKVTVRGKRFMDACGPLLAMVGIDPESRFPRNGSAPQIVSGDC